MSECPTARSIQPAKARTLLARIASWLMGASLMLAFAVVATPKAWADTIATFDVTSTPGSSGIFSSDGYSFGAGSEITIDTTNGTVQSADITVDNSTGLVATFSGLPSVLNSPAAYVWYDGSAEFGVSALPNLFIGFTGCTNCAGIFFQFPTLVSGSVTLTDPPSSTPEPGSVALLGSGLLGLAALTLRRKRSA